MLPIPDRPYNKQMQRTRHGQAGASPLICVFSGRPMLTLRRVGGRARPMLPKLVAVVRSGLILISVLTGVLFCRVTKGGGQLPYAPVRAREALLGVVPRGTTLVNAQGSMARQGFACVPQVDASFQGISGMRSHLDYIYCDQRTSGVVYTRWQVALIHEHGKVTDVDVSVSRTGP
jgi:hypothetical protein